MKFHEMFKQKRMEAGTVREFAKRAGLDVAYVSRLENGVILPPKDSNKLARLAGAVGIVRGSDEWQEFMDLAAVAKNELPEDLRDDERVASMLPAFYRTLRKKELDERELKKLLDLIKGSGEGSVAEDLGERESTRNNRERNSDQDPREGDPARSPGEAQSMVGPGKGSARECGEKGSTNGSGRKSLDQDSGEPQPLTTHREEE